jgi:hypothetical protein
VLRIGKHGGQQMAEVHVSFSNRFGESRFWNIWDTGRDPNVPKPIFADYLGAHESTDPLPLYAEDGADYGNARYQRSDGQATNVEVRDGAFVDME